MEMALLGVHRDAGVVAHVFVCTGGDVEKGSLSAVGVSHQRDADIMVPFLGHMGQGPFQPLRFFQVSGKRLQVFVTCERLAGLLFGDHLDLPGFLPPQGYFVADDFVFDGSLPWIKPISMRRLRKLP